MTYSDQRPRLREEPPKELLSWDVTWEGEPRKRQQCVDVSVWVPTALAQWEMDHCWDSGRCRLTRLADYVRENLGFEVCGTSGWGAHFKNPPEELSAVNVPVRVKGVRAALAAR